MAEEETEVQSLVPVILRDTRTEYVTREVNINRAPTDASVKLLREMEANAEAEVIKAVQVGDTSFECVVHQFQDMMSDKMHMRAVFKLNGKQMTSDISVDTRDARDLNAMFIKLRDEIAKTIASEVLHGAFVEMARNRFAR